jgi:hypothetical protein
MNSSSHVISAEYGEVQNELHFYFVLDNNVNHIKYRSMEAVPSHKLNTQNINYQSIIILPTFIKPQNLTTFRRLDCVNLNGDCSYNIPTVESLKISNMHSMQI